MTQEQKWIEAIKKHAQDHYNKDGWDYVVECFTDEEIAEEIQSASNEQEAIQIMHKLVKERDDYRKDIQAEIF